MGISKLQGLWVTCNPHKFEIPALRFPYKPPVNPCKHLQCINTLLKHKHINIIMYGNYSRGGYDGARTVYFTACCKNRKLINVQVL